MIVADASGLVALGSVDAIEPFVDEFDVRTTPAAIEAVADFSTRHGPAGQGARTVLACRDRLTFVEPRGEPIVTSRLGDAAGSCVVLARELDAGFSLTDAMTATHELRRLVPGEVVTPSIGLLALVRCGRLRWQDGRFRLETLLERRRGGAAAIGERSRTLFERTAP